MRSLALVVMVAMLACTAVAASEEPPRVEIERLGKGTLARVELPGKLIATAVPRGRDGKRELLLLVGTTTKTDEIDPERPEIVQGEDIPREETSSDRKLYRVDWSREAPIELLDIDIVAMSSSLREIDLDDDGVDEILVAGPDGVYLIARQEDGSLAISLEPLVPELLRVLTALRPKTLERVGG